MYSMDPRRPTNRGLVSIFVLLVLFAVLGSFVLGMGSQEPASQVPSVNFDFEATDSGTVTITHSGGEALLRSETEIRTSGTVGEWPGPELTAGEQITVSDLDSGETIEVVWNAPDGDSSAVIATYTVP